MISKGKLTAVAGAGLCMSLAVIGNGQAQDSGRYTMEKTAQGYVRLDNRTGEMSICTEQSGQLVCKLAAEERRAFEDELASLSERVKKLEDTVAANGGVAAAPRETLPSDEEFEKTMGYMEQFFRRFMGIVKDFQNEEPSLGTPQKT